MNQKDKILLISHFSSFQVQDPCTKKEEPEGHESACDVHRGSAPLGRRQVQNRYFEDFPAFRSGTILLLLFFIYLFIYFIFILFSIFLQHYKALIRFLRQIFCALGKKCRAKPEHGQAAAFSLERGRNFSLQDPRKISSETLSAPFCSFLSLSFIFCFLGFFLSFI